MIVVTDRSSQLVTAQCNLAGVAQVKNTRHDRDVRHAREREIERERERERERDPSIRASVFDNFVYTHS